MVDREGRDRSEWRDPAAFTFVLLTLPSCCTPSTKATPARTSGRRCAPSRCRHRACGWQPSCCRSTREPHSRRRKSAADWTQAEPTGPRKSATRHGVA